MTAAPLDPIGVNRRLLVGDVHTRARATFTPPPIARGALGLAGMSDIVRLPRMIDLVGGPVTPAWTKGLVSMALTAQLDQTRLLAPSIHAALAATSPTHLIAPALAGAIRGASTAGLAAPMLASIPRVSTGLSPARAGRITRELEDLVEAQEPALDEEDAADLVALLELEDAPDELVAFGALQSAALDLVDSDPIAELMEYVDPGIVVDPAKRTEEEVLDEDTVSTLAKMRGRLSALSTGEITTMVLASSSLVSTATLDMFGVDISFIGRHISLPMSILAIASSIKNVNDAARERERRDGRGGADSDRHDG